MARWSHSSARRVSPVRPRSVATAPTGATNKLCDSAQNTQRSCSMSIRDWFVGDPTLTSTPTVPRSKKPSFRPVFETLEDRRMLAAGILQFLATAYSVEEKVATVHISVTRTRGRTGAVSVHYATSDGTATAGLDYVGKSGTLNWARGETRAKTFTISIIDDSLVEGNETVNLKLDTPTGGAKLGTRKSAVLTIIDN